MQQNIWILWDLLALFIIVWNIYRCAKKGFLRTVVAVICYAAAAILAKVLSPAIAVWLYNNYIGEIVRGVVFESVEQSLQQGANAAGNLIVALPGWLQMAAGPYLPDKNVEIPAIQLDNTTKQIIGGVVDSALIQPITWLMTAVLFLFLFSLMAVLVRMIARLFDGINKLPVVGTVNTILGGIIGVLQGAVVLLVVSAVLNLLIFFTSNTLWWMNESVLDSTYILWAFQRFIPGMFGG